MAKGSSGSAKNCTGTVLSVSRNRAQTCTGQVQKVAPVSEKITGPGAASLFSKVPVLATVNPAISDAAHRLLTFMAIPGLGDGTSVLSAPEIAESLGWSLRKAKYCIADLLRLDIVAVDRKTGKPNAYAIRSEVFAAIPRQTRAERIIRAKTLVKCLKCPKLFPGHKTGWCLKCRREVELDAKIRRIATAVVAQSA